jgi:peptidyl-prolyl cis-trans isomerase C
MTMTHIRPALLLTAFLAMLAACKPAETGPTESADAKAASPSVATVNGKAISKATFDEFLNFATQGRVQEINEEQKTQLLDQLINMEVVAQAAEKDGLAKDAELQSRLDLIRSQLLADAASTKYVEANPVTDAEIKAEYDAQVANQPKQYRARHILVDDKAVADDVIKQLQGGADFAKLAKDKSKDSSAANGGDLDWFSPQSMVKPFADAVIALEKGQFTQAPVQSQFGWHVIKLDDVRTPEPPAYDDVKDQVKMIAQRKKLQAYIDGLKATAKIEKTPVAADETPVTQ